MYNISDIGWAPPFSIVLVSLYPYCEMLRLDKASICTYARINVVGQLYVQENIALLDKYWY